MPKFVFKDSQGRTYSNLNGGPLVVVPGQIVVLDEDPNDGRWEPSESPQGAPQAPESPAETTHEDSPAE